MALAIHMDQLLCDAQVKDQAELAELAGVTRARVTQIMAFLTLAPAIQETLLFANPAAPCHFTPAEHVLRPLMTAADWNGQIRLWKRTLQQAESSTIVG